MLLETKAKLSLQTLIDDYCEMCRSRTYMSVRSTRELRNYLRSLRGLDIGWLFHASAANLGQCGLPHTSPSLLGICGSIFGRGALNVDSRNPSLVLSRAFPGPVIANRSTLEAQLSGSRPLFIFYLIMGATSRSLQLPKISLRMLGSTRQLKTLTGQSWAADCMFFEICFKEL